MQLPPSDDSSRLAWLVDRACISDLLVHYARLVDERRFEELADLFTADGVLELPFAEVSRDSLPKSSHKHLGPFASTHHMSSNHAIEIAEITAKSRSYMQAAHVPDSDSQDVHGDIGGWYDCDYRRTTSGWRFARIRLTFVWTLGGPLPGA
jgi:SnoaL-like domain